MSQSPQQSPIRREGIPLGRIFGVPVILAYSWFLIAGFIMLVFGPQLVPGLGSAAYWVALGYALLLLLSVLVHELAHAVTARLFHWPTAKIVLTIWGGHTQFGNFSATPAKSLLVALAGPAANLVLAGLGLLLLPAVNTSLIALTLTNIFVWTNFLVAVFNVLPGLPLDGGRIVESAVWKFTGNQDKGTVAAGWAGRIIVVALIVVTVGIPLLQGAQPSLQFVVITVLVAGFLWMGASSSIANARMRLRLPAISAGKLKRPAVSITAGTTVAQARAVLGAVVPGTPGYGAGGQAAIIVVAPTGQPEAVVDAGAMASVPPELAASTPVNAVARALAPGAYVPEAAAGQELVQYLAQLAGSEYAVIDRTGRVTGLLHQSTVIAAITGKSNPHFGL